MHSNAYRDIGMEDKPLRDAERDTPPARPPHFAREGVRRRQRWLLLVIGLIVLLLLGGALYWYLVMRKQPAAKTTAPTPQAVNQQANTAVSDSTPTTYKSSKLNIEFIYRKDWKVRESADKSEISV